MWIIGPDFGYAQSTMNMKILLALTTALFFPIFAEAQTITNSSFESGMDGWIETDPNKKTVSISGEASEGDASVKILSKDGNVSQTLTLSPNTNYRLRADVKGSGIIGVKADGQIFYDGATNAKKWKTVDVVFNSGSASTGFVFASGRGKKGGRFDGFSLTRVDGEAETSKRVISRSAGGYGLSPDVTPAQNFDLLGWTLTTPADDNGDGKADLIKETELAKGYTHDKYFYTGPDGGMVMTATVAGAKTSKNTKNVRSELREMLRRGDKSIKTRDSDGYPNKNNWVFSTAPAKSQKMAGGVDGRLTATLAVNHVTTTGRDDQIGIVVIGQIHGKDDEPIKIMYRKLPNHENGVVYVAHEPVGEDDVYYDLVGKKKDRRNNPVDGIALNEVFSYEILAKGHTLETRIFQNGKVIGEAIIDQSKSGYDVAKEFNYFKAGTYNQNHTGDPDDYAQATFYELKAEH